MEEILGHLYTSRTQPTRKPQERELWFAMNDVKVLAGTAFGKSKHPTGRDSSSRGRFSGDVSLNLET